MSSDPSIIEFLTARLDEDEALAESVVGDPDLDPTGNGGFNVFDPDPAAYLTRFSPARVLADIAASRAIIQHVTAEVHEWGRAAYEAGDDPGVIDDAMDVRMATNPVLGALAGVYIGHPEYGQWHV